MTEEKMQRLVKAQMNDMYEPALFEHQGFELVEVFPYPGEREYTVEMDDDFTLQGRNTETDEIIEPVNYKNPAPDEHDFDQLKHVEEGDTIKLYVSGYDDDAIQTLTATSSAYATNEIYGETLYMSTDDIDILRAQILPDGTVTIEGIDAQPFPGVAETQPEMARVESPGDSNE